MTDPTPAYGQYCPISRALDVLGERWSLLILRDLFLGTTRFNDLARGLPGLSRSLLAKRLRQFERAGLLDKIGPDHLLTEAGRDLQPILFGLGAWGARWSFGAPRQDELDAALLVWWMHQRLDTTALPGRRQVLLIRFTDDIRRFWIVIEAGIPSVCETDPGYPVDITVVADVAGLYEVWLGRMPLTHAQRTGRVHFHGPPGLTRRMPTILQLSPIAGAVREATAPAARAS
ncbi:winged helix-turn-helix transcriptional regulator [Nocardia sp. SSK8]|uniref:winged helix-turn-helix transcriptional regulator n=1 Tax=Nocardia sp. SSK8 TaxID=3120154 RepID=UPI00300B46EE